MTRQPSLSHLFATVGNLAPQEEMPWGARHVWLRDPDGRRISIYSSPHDTK